MKLSLLSISLFLLCLSGCGKAMFNDEMVSGICFIPTERLVGSWPSPFPPLSVEETGADWAVELQMGKAFAKELDLFRAITCFKRAGFLSPPYSRIQEIDFCLLFAYYLGGKYQEAILILETGSISSVDRSFPAFDTMVTALWECYHKTGQCEKADAIFPLMQEGEQQAITTGEEVLAITPPEPLQSCYCDLRIPPAKVRAMQAIVPGAGYLYMGQTKSAITSFLLNGLFIWATVELFQHGHTAWGIFTLSLESGWYFGGINGAGLLAKEYNSQVYNTLGKEYMMKERLFPLLQINYGF